KRVCRTFFTSGGRLRDRCERACLLVNWGGGYYKNVSYPSFLLILGIDAGRIENVAEGFIPRFADKAVKTLEKEIPPVIVPPYPSKDFVLAFVDKTFSRGLQEYRLQNKYREYSFFIHSYFASWHIFPFSSVLEFKIVKYELTIFLQVIKKVLEMYLNVYEA
ncbi:MAG: hypothetical protein ACXQT5_03885, partial [Candidatus Syntropharchaeia archaeon]